MWYETTARSSRPSCSRAAVRYRTVPASACSGSKRASIARRCARSCSASATFPRLHGVCDLNRQPPALFQVDGHAEEVLRGLGEDLREAGRRHRIVPRDDLRPAATLEEHDRFDEVCVESAVRDGVLDERPEGLRALGGREDASRALGVERVAEPERGSTLEVFGLRVVVHEHVGAGDLRTGHEHACGVVSGRECDPACEGGRGERRRPASPRRAVGGAGSCDRVSLMCGLAARRCENARMATLPSGTVTFVFSDIEGSTALLKRLGERYAELIAEHRRIVREAFSAHGGVEIDMQGDSFFFAFARARDAATAAVEAQRAHAEHAWPDGESRAGAHGSPHRRARSRHGGLSRRRRRAHRSALRHRAGRTRPAVRGDARARRIVAARGSLRTRPRRATAQGHRRAEKVYELAIDGVDQPEVRASCAGRARGGLGRPHGESERAHDRADQRERAPLARALARQQWERRSAGRSEHWRVCRPDGTMRRPCRR